MKQYIRYKIGWHSNKEMFVAKLKVSKKCIDVPTNLKSYFYSDDINDIEFDIKEHYKMNALYKRKNEWVFTNL